MINLLLEHCPWIEAKLIPQSDLKPGMVVRLRFSDGEVHNVNWKVIDSAEDLFILNIEGVVNFVSRHNDRTHYVLLGTSEITHKDKLLANEFLSRRTS